MAVLKCKMCGGDLQIDEGVTVCECEYCSTKQTVPTIDSEKKAKLFERANRFRMECQFDKAATIYESIIEEFDSEAEGYWGNLLCKYGIEYVDDPTTGDKIPTCHRSSFDSLMEDKDFESVMDYADSISRNVYREQAKQIEEIRKGIIEVSGKEEPYDIFICYKETAEDGQRTLDSVLAQDVYDELSDKGYRVFFSRITLEDKLGTEYEPYIFAALNSAKVMLVFGTSYDYYNAVWVKNEWSRYLKLMTKDKTKHFIPCYKDIDAYDIPKEFARFQAQDLGKVGAIQDLIRGVEKIVGVKKSIAIATNVLENQECDNLVRRGYMALEDEDCSAAEKFFEEALNRNPESAEAYLGKLLVTNSVDSFDKYLSKLERKYSQAASEKLCACNEEVEHINSVVRENVVDGYLDANKIKNLYRFDRAYNSSLSCRKEQKEKQLTEIESDKLLSRVRQYAVGELKGQVESGLERLVSILDVRILDEEQRDEAVVAEIIANYQSHIIESDKKVSDLCSEASQKKYRYYESIVADMNSATTVSAFEKAGNSFRSLGEYEDSRELAEKCQTEIDRLREKESKEKERLAHKRILKIVVSSCIIVIAFVLFFVVTKFIVPNDKYQKAIGLMNNAQYNEAIAMFMSLNGYKDSNAQITNCQIALQDIDYNRAIDLMNNGQYEEAIIAFGNLGEYRDSSEKLNQILRLTGYVPALSIGDTFYYGNNDGESIEWTILDKKDNQVLVITTDGVNRKHYSILDKEVTWSSCYLRTWLNDEFYNEVFNSEEQARIDVTNVSPGINPNYTTDAGSSTEDKLFLLSIDEVTQYFCDDNARVCEYNGSPCWWWLRSPGINQDRTVGVDVDGSVYYLGEVATNVSEVVRPAMWLSFE